MDDNFLRCDEVFMMERVEEEDVVQENGGGDDDDDDNDDDDVDDDDDDDSSDDDDDPDPDQMNDVQLLIGTESDRPVLSDQQVIIQMINDNWIQEIRTHAINYILGAGQRFGFSYLTLYTAVIYVDRYLTVRIIRVGEYTAVRLLAVTCLSLSAKMEETRHPALSHYPVTRYNITVDDIRRMELSVLDDLNWSMIHVTPFTFIQYFVSRFCRQVPMRRATRMRAGEIIMSVVGDLTVMNHRPSVIAAAATLLAVSYDFTIEQLEMEINALPLNGLLQIGNVYICYYSLLERNI